MATMLSEVYEAFRSVNIDEARAQAAAEALSAFESRFAELRSDLRMVNLKLDVVIGVLVLFGLPLTWLVFRMAAKMGALHL
jgi:hypothetical protein